MKAGQRPRIFKTAIKTRFRLCEDVVEGSILALEAKQSGIYNLGSGQARSFNELVDVLNKCLGTNFNPTTSKIRTRITRTSPKRTWTKFAARSLSAAILTRTRRGRYVLWLYPAEKYAQLVILSGAKDLPPVIDHTNKLRDLGFDCEIPHSVRDDKSAFPKKFVGRLISGGRLLCTGQLSAVCSSTSRCGEFGGSGI